MLDTSIIANTPEITQSVEVKAKAEEALKMELLKELSIDDVRAMILAAKSGAFTNSHDEPDTFDEKGRNYRRMVHKIEVSGPSGSVHTEERPMAHTLLEARKNQSDWYDPDGETWVLYGYKRQADYPENTVGYWENR